MNPWGRRVAASIPNERSNDMHTHPEQTMRNVHPLTDIIAATIIAQGCCAEAQARDETIRLADLTSPLKYSRWRHGGWYVGIMRYPSGACGCVSRTYADKQ